MKTKKLFILVLAVAMLFAGFASVAFAAEITALTESNIAVWPTFEGEMFYGQKLNEGNLQIVGGVVTLDGTADGTVVEGHFEFTDPEYRPTQITGNYASITFIPDDTDSYAGFTVSENENAVYAVSKTNPVLQDPENDPPVAKQIAAGKRVMLATLSGGTLMNPYTKEVIAEGKWAWTTASRTKVVNESGYFQAVSSVGVGELKNYYNNINMYVYVRIEGDTAEEKMLTTVVEEPTITTTKFTVGDAWSAVSFTGGKVVDLNGIEVDGEFKITNMGTMQHDGNDNAQFMFIPSDDYYSTVSFAIPIVVDACPISFGPDQKGTSIDDPYIFEVAPHADMGDVSYELKYNHLNWPGTGSAFFYNENTTAVNGQVYEYRVVNYNNSNYTGNIAYVKLVFTTTEITPTIVRASGGGFKVDCAGHSVPGTFTVYCNGEEIATVSRKESYVFQCEVFTDEGGTFNIVAKYNPTENDYFVCNDAEVTYVVPAMHSVTNAGSADNSTYGISMKVLGSSSFTARAGQTVELRATLDSFVCWTFKDADGNEVTLEGVDLNAKQNTFIMPDYDLFVSYKIQEDIDREEAIANCDHLCHSDNEFIQLFWNILNMFFRLLNVQQYCDCGELHYSAPLFPIA